MDVLRTPIGKPLTVVFLPILRFADAGGISLPAGSNKGRRPSTPQGLPPLTR